MKMEVKLPKNRAKSTKLCETRAKFAEFSKIKINAKKLWKE